MEAERRAEVWQRSTRTSTRWSFTSGWAREAAPLPLLSLHAAMPLSRGNATPLETMTFPVSVYLPREAAPAQVKRLTVSTSSDGGSTWKAAAVRRTAAAGFEVTVDHGSHRGPVTLRMAAVDASGASVTQTVHAAYAVR